jgi:putative Mn2+ efflux pump MntP
MTGFVSVMWSVWGALVLLVVGLKVYMSSLARDEDDQLILDDSFDNVKFQQAAIVAKLAKIEPMQKVALWLAGAASVVVAAYYVRDILLSLHLVG